MKSRESGIRPAAPASEPRRGLELIVRDLGRMSYVEALAVQRELHASVVASRGECGDQAIPADSRCFHLLLVEHDPPVITVSARKTARQHLVATSEQLARAGVEVCETDRGGDITYHGPGQLIAYPILDLNTLGLRLHSYMRFLEQVVIDTLAHFKIEGRRDPAATGVWAGDPPAKVCAMGVRVSRWVTMHGLALNVTTNLDHFNLIVPCGLAGRSVTSVKQILGDGCPTMAQVKQALAERLERGVIDASVDVPAT